MHEKRELKIIRKRSESKFILNFLFLSMSTILTISVNTQVKLACLFLLFLQSLYLPDLWAFTDYPILFCILLFYVIF